MIFEGKKKIIKREIVGRIWIIRKYIDNPLRQEDILKLWRCRGKIEYEEMKEMISEGYVVNDWGHPGDERIEGFIMVGSVKGDHINFPDGPRYVTKDYLKMYKPKKLSDGIGTNKDSLSKIINGYSEKGKHYPGLIDEGILKKTFVKGKVGYSLVNNYQALTKILIEFSNPSFSKSLIKELRKDLMNSDYAKKLINQDLVKMKGYELNEQELNFMLIILKISPSALFKYLFELDKTIAYNKNPDNYEFPKGYDNFLNTRRSENDGIDEFTVPSL